jgi:hypothetical protein
LGRIDVLGVGRSGGALGDEEEFVAIDQDAAERIEPVGGNELRGIGRLGGIGGAAERFAVGEFDLARDVMGG